MSSEDARTLANSLRGFVVAPAGCGKTFLLAEAVSISDGRQLILTHTHAGVRAIRGHLERRAVPPAKYVVITIDGLALRYASAFPTLSGWTTAIPVGDDWRELRSLVLKVFRQKAIQRVLAASYNGVFVDEYQDCTIDQHHLIQSLTEFLPVRVVGDPLQAVFASFAKDDFCSWSNVEAAFDKVGEFSTPHRWLQNNESLGKWLLSVRANLIDGKEVNLKDAPISYLPTTPQKDDGRRSACYSLRSKKGESHIGLRKWGNECHHLARSLGGRFRSMEPVECDDLLKWADRIQSSSGIQKAIDVLEFADACIACIPGNIKNMATQIAAGKVQNPRRTDYRRVLKAIQSVAASSTLEMVVELMDSICGLEDKIVIARNELWSEMRRSIKEFQSNPSTSLRQTAWDMRNRLRQFGSKLDRSTLGTPLLVKGLEFDHAIVLDASDHTDAESLYVSLTRGSKSLTILSDQLILKRAKPLFVRNLQSE